MWKSVESVEKCGIQHFLSVFVNTLMRFYEGKDAPSTTRQ